MAVEYIPGLAGVPAARSKVCLIDGRSNGAPSGPRRG